MQRKAEKHIDNYEKTKNSVRGIFVWLALSHASPSLYKIMLSV